MKVVEIEGKTVDAAKKTAQEVYNISDDDKIEVVDEGKSGIFGFGTSRPAKIRIYYNDLDENVPEKVRDFMDNLIKKMGFEGAVYEIKEGRNKIYVSLKSQDSALIIGSKGRTLEALQLLVNMAISHWIPSTEKRIIVDIEGYRKKREAALSRLARLAAQNVIKSGKPRILEPMNPFERRLIHLTLQNDRRINTISEGNGVYKRIKVELARKQ